ncbi:MAG: hypothetical protein Tsb009_18540 [Planctomycetaceae bacterium]
MSESVNIDLDKAQRDLLLQGLRYVRSSVLLGFREPSAEDTQKREKKLRDIEALVDQLNGNMPAEVAAGV